MTDRVVSREEWGTIQVRLLWLVLETVAWRLLGEKGLEFVKEFYEEAAKTWLSIMEKDYGVVTKKAKTLKEAVENYIEVGVAGWLFRSKTDFILEEEDKKRLKIKVFRCPWSAHCIDMLKHPPFVGPTPFEAKSPKQLLTCPRIGCFRGAVKLLANIKCDYRLITSDPPKICEGEITVIE